MTTPTKKMELDTLVNDAATVRLVSGYKRSPLCQIVMMDDGSGRYEISNEWFVTVIKPKWVRYITALTDHIDIHVETWILADMDCNPPVMADDATPFDGSHYPGSEDEEHPREAYEGPAVQ